MDWPRWPRASGRLGCETPQAALARELVEELDAHDVSVDEFVGAAEHCYRDLSIKIEAYWVCENLEHDTIFGTPMSLKPQS